MTKITPNLNISSRMRFCSHSNNSQSVLSGLKPRGEALKLQYPRDIAPLRNRTGEERRRQILRDKRDNNNVL